MTLDPLKSRIIENGPVPLDVFMQEANRHYYAHHPAIGQDGDFITAPEISQIFGEMVGLWVLAHWNYHGKPSAFTLCECGPGRGTLMRDALKAIESIPEAKQACHVTLLENSPAMREHQRQAIQHESLDWIDRLDDLTDNGPVILIANEFLDALPIQQFIKSEQGWMQKMIGLEPDGSFSVGLSPHSPLPFDHIKTGQTIELAPQRIAVCKHIKSLLQKRGGSALLIDYGYHVPPVGETLQALFNKRPCQPHEHAGEADLTAHVDFHSLVKLFADMPHILTTQAAWLTGMGAPARLERLISGNPAHAETLKSGYQRLSAPDQMGDLFKVLEIRSA